MSLTEREIHRTVRVFNALANEVRIKALLAIHESKRPLHITAVAKILEIEYAALYRHIKILTKSGLLVSYDVGRSQVLALNHGDYVIQLLELVNNFEDTYG